MEKLLVAYAIKYKGNYKKMKDAINTQEYIDKETIDDYLKQMNCKWTTILSKDYPKCFFDLTEPPFVLFYKGDLNLINQPCISMVGMRQPNDYGIAMASSISKKISEDFVICSGLAYGIDTYSHLNARKTIAVLGCGIDYCYPAKNRKLYNHIAEKGLIISEFPGMTKPEKYYFGWRNRLIACIGKALIVVQANRKSGSMITVGHALDLGRIIFAVPGRLSDPDGTLYLINDGAIILKEIADIYNEVN